MREELSRRPLLVAFLGLCAGLSAGFGAANLLWAGAFIPLLWKRPTIVVLFLSVLAGWALRPHPLDPVRVKGGAYQGLVRVIDVPSTERGRLTAAVMARGKPYRLLLPEDSRANLGDVLAVRANVIPLSERAIRHHLEVANLAVKGKVVEVERGSPVWRWSVEVRRSFLTFVERHADPAAVGLIEALCLNVTSDIGPGFYDDLRRSGTVHVVSASGLHVTVLCAALAWLLLALPAPRWVQTVLLVFGLFVFAAAAGFHPPMVRAVVMVLACASAYVWRREADALSALALAGVADLLWRPYDVADLGFQLSFLSVGALVLFGRLPADDAAPRLGRRLSLAAGALARASVVATVASLPLVAATFGEVSVVAVLSNLLVVPVLGLVVVTSFLAWSLSCWVLPVSVGLLKLVVEPVVGWIGACVETIGSWPLAAVPLPQVPTFWLVPVYLALAALYEPKRSPTDTSHLVVG